MTARIRIVLKPVEGEFDGIAVGTLNGHPLVYQGRTPTVNGEVLEHSVIANALVEAVDHAASQILGSDWVVSLSRLLMINRRSTAKDRIGKFGLPTYALQTLGTMAAHPNPRALGFVVMAGVVLKEQTGSDEALESLTGPASRLLQQVSDAREEFRQRRPMEDDAPTAPGM